MSRDSAHLDSIGAELRIDVHLAVGDRSGAAGTSTALSPSSSPPLVEGPLLAGRIVGGRYELVRLIGLGSMGAVWIANHLALGEYVAIKLMSPMACNAVEDASTSAARFRFEAQIAARLSRKTRHVVRVTDHGQDGTRPYLVMELLEGQTLESAILCRGPMGLPEVCDLVVQIARGLEAAHSEGVLHRDLKPANVFLADNHEGRPVVKLLDFGVARGHVSQRLAAPYATARGLIVGTPGYMSPEQAAAAEIDVRSDLWALSAIAYEALTRELPVAGSDAERMMSDLRACRTVPIRQHRPDLPERLGAFFQRAFAPRIEDRYASCAELAEAFEQAAGLGSPITRCLPPRPLPAVQEERSRVRGRTYARIGAVAFLAGVGLLGTWYASARSRSNNAPARDAATIATDSSHVQTTSTPAHEDLPPLMAQGGKTSSSIPAPPPPAAAQRPARRLPDGELGEFKAYY